MLAGSDATVNESTVGFLANCGTKQFMCVLLYSLGQVVG